MEEDLSKFIIEFQNENFSSFECFYASIKNKIFYNILSLTNNYDLAEDLLQETFVKFLSSVKKIKADSNVLGFLMVCSRNLTLDYFRKNNRVQIVEFNEKIDSFIEKSNHDNNVNEILEKIRKILNDKEFEIFTLHVMSELSFKEISKLKKRPIGTVLWAYNNALKKIRKEIDYERV